MPTTPKAPSTASPNWTRRQTLAALHIYFQLPFGQLHRGQPKIKQIAQWIGRTPSSVALKLVNLASLDPQIVASGRKGMANASTQDKAIWQELQGNWDAVALEAAAEYETLATSHGLPANVDVIDEPPETLDITEGKTRMATVEVRVNQARFRKAILASYNATCCISGLQHEKLLVASHIVPWSEDKQNRLNPHNGLCLSALHDRAYDQGLITVMPDYTVRVSKTLLVHTKDSFLKESLLRFDKQLIQLPEKFKPAQTFLATHAQRFGFTY
jgi:putative restriction endonuclease